MKVIGVIADCEDCNWRNEEYHVADDAAKRHSRNYKHRTCVEITRLKWHGKRTEVLEPEVKK